ncbi:hypothetical protein DSM43518_04179 [Mycobacterium marinum]|nr:hypothetical protein MM1218R_02641 [Mycobacterium marinum]QYL28577.1 hypothetical protein TM48_02924 [Mycobacterium shottsii]CDM76700.1 conserved membrane protein [Mycobacterium marinum E11]AXN49939.1 hypothetical protein CCUG20998_02534 [Mycobacterium marinum]RFZ01913.1 hypothetical protein DE4381_05073 [Mycobacterium marinum]
MKNTSTLAVTLTATVTLAATALVGCSSNTGSSPSSSSQSSPSNASSASSAATAAPTDPADYARLLIQASEIDAPEAFTASPPVRNPDGRPGVSTSFSNDDRSHVINDTIWILPDPAAATSALDQRKNALDGIVTGTPDPFDVGVGGIAITGLSPDGTKGVTVLLFTQGRALAELEFDGPAEIPAPPEFVTDVGRKQDAAIKKGLTG